MRFTKSFTPRGFKILNFYDSNDTQCDIQRSSSIRSKIWLGTHSPSPKIMAKKIDPNGIGWVDYPIPDDVLIRHRMHLNRKQCISLAMRLLRFGLFDKL